MSSQIVITSDGTQIEVPPSRAKYKIEPHPPGTRERAFDLYRADKTLAQIAEAMDLPVYTVSHWSSDEKWKARKDAELNGHTLALPAESKAPDAKHIPPDFAEKQALFTDRTAEAAVKIAERMAELTGTELIAQADRVSKAFAMGQKALRLTEDKAVSIIVIPLLNQGIKVAGQSPKLARKLDDCLPIEAE